MDKSYNTGYIDGWSTTIGLETYLRYTDDALLQLVLQHETKKKLYSIQKEAEEFRAEFEVPNFDRAANERVTKFARRVKQKVKQQAQDIEVRQWKERELHGRYNKRIREEDVDDYKTNQWLKRTGLKAETEGLIIAAQDQSLPTQSYFARIVKDSTSPLCKVWHKHEETVDHIISGSPELAKTDHLERHNKAAAYIHCKAFQHYSTEVPEGWYDFFVFGNPLELVFIWRYISAKIQLTPCDV